jgi:tetratricopeptide (TPR) repeat protein
MSLNADRIRSLRANGDHDAALRLAHELVRAEPTDAEVQYEVACLFDYRGEEAAAVEYYTAAIAAGLSDDLLRSAYLGLGSTYRALGSYAQALATLDEGLCRFPGALDLKVFRAMALYNAGQGKEAVETLLRVVVQSTSDVELAKYRRAIELYADDIDRKWP